MSDDRTQISAFIARETKSRLEEYTASTGTKKGAVVEEALKAYLEERTELPAEYVIGSELVLSAAALERLLALIEDPAEPTDALRALMASRGASASR